MKIGEKYRYLAKNTILFTISNFSNKLIIFFLLPFYTAFLTTGEYAIIDLISITQQLIFPIITLDITEAVIRFGMETKNDKSSIFTIGLLVTTIGNIVLGGSCLAGSILFAGNATYIVYFFIFSVVVSINTLLSSFLRTIDKVHLITVSSIVNTLLATSLNIVFIVKLHMGIDGYYIAYIIGNIFAIIIMTTGLKVRRYLKRITKEEFRLYISPMMKYAIPLMPNALFWWVNSSLDRYFLTALSTLSYVGMYAAANKIPSILSTLTSIFQQSWGLSMFKESDTKSKKDFFDLIFNLYNIFIFLVSIILIFGAEMIAHFLLSKEFFYAWTWVPWLVFGFYSNAISSFIGTEFTVAKKTTWILITTLISAVVNIVLNFILIPKYNGLGAAIATCLSYFVLVELRILIINKKFNLYINNIKILLLHLILTASIIISTQFQVVWRFVGFVILTVVFVLIEKKEIMSFISILRNKFIKHN